MWELWKRRLDKGKSDGAIFMNLPKAFDTFNHDLLIVKLEAKLLLIIFKVTNAVVYKEQMWIINFSLWKDIFAGGPHWSVLGPLLIYMLMAYSMLKVSLYVCTHTKIIPWRFCILNPKNSQVIYP